MLSFWTGLATGALDKAAEISTDLMPILAIMFGIPVGERVLHVIRRLVAR